MILEIAELTVLTGQADAFEAAYAAAQRHLAAADGYRGHELLRGVERPDRYTLLVRWDSVEAHTTGFRQSAHYQAWRALVHPFLAGPAAVFHYRPVA